MATALEERFRNLRKTKKRRKSAPPPKSTPTPTARPTIRLTPTPTAAPTKESAAGAVPVVCAVGQQPCGHGAWAGGYTTPDTYCCDAQSECTIGGIHQGYSTVCKRKDRIQTCNPNPCQNGGICAMWSDSVFLTSTFLCECLVGWQGTKCETPQTAAYSPPVITVPTTLLGGAAGIEAENFSNQGGEGVDYHNIPKGEPGPNFNVLRRSAISVEWVPYQQYSSKPAAFTVVGWTGPGEWLRYQINVITTGNYRVTYSIARGIDPPAPVGFSLLIDAAPTPTAESVDKLCRNNPNKVGAWAGKLTTREHGSLDAAAAPSWIWYVDEDGGVIHLPGGQHTLTLCWDAGDANIDNFTLTPVA
eukprot:TRINITY_DN6678_c0_g1_i1.p2 TRINITY_DN6678_c0_g1~~TRINITY_DN6678_c0_g1_i1.p2  ORF type:complete len:359 (+),score=41.84 TRINITY_DN6678_c0_g1_i1:460-1536(+)